MGADIFEACSSGKDAQEAFIEARNLAQYDHGHSGYTGTIAEKGSFVEFQVPEGMDPLRFMALALEWEPGKEETAEAEKHGATTVLDKARKVVDDKWGPAACVKLADYEGARPNDYAFFGWASC